MSSPNTRPRALAALLLVLVLAVGVLAGIALDRLLLLPRAAIAGEVATPRAPEREAGARHDEMRPLRADARYLDFIERELELTAEQRARIEEILQRQQERVLEITRDTRPQVQAVARETRSAINEILTPEQQARFQELRARRDRSAGRHPPAGQLDTIRERAPNRGS